MIATSAQYVKNDKVFTSGALQTKLPTTLVGALNAMGRLDVNRRQSGVSPMGFYGNLGRLLIVGVINRHRSIRKIANTHRNFASLLLLLLFARLCSADVDKSGAYL